MQWDSSSHHCPFGPVSFFCFPLSFWFSSLFLSFVLSKGKGPQRALTWRGLGWQKGWAWVRNDSAGWGLELVGRSEKWGLPEEPSGERAQHLQGDIVYVCRCVQTWICTCGRESVVGRYGPSRTWRTETFIFIRLSTPRYPNATPIPVNSRSLKPVTPNSLRCQAFGQFPAHHYCLEKSQVVQWDETTSNINLYRGRRLTGLPHWGPFPSLAGRH